MNQGLWVKKIQTVNICQKDLMDEDMDSQGLIDEGISEDGFYDE